MGEEDKKLFGERIVENRRKFGNLIMPEKGEIRNPGGRGKGKKDGFRAHMRRLLAKNYEPHEAIEKAAEKVGIDYRCVDKTGSNADVLAQIRLMQALMGDARAIEDIADRTDGKATQAVEVAGALDIGVGIMSPVEVEEIEAELRAEGWRLPED